MINFYLGINNNWPPLNYRKIWCESIVQFVADTMSWFKYLASKAENILNTIDETTATALHTSHDDTKSSFSQEFDW